MAKLFLITCCLLLSISANAQRRSVQGFEGEFAFGVAIPTTIVDEHPYTTGFGYAYVLEYRYNFATPISVGFQLSLSYLRRYTADSFEIYDYTVPSSFIFNINAFATCDYNFLSGRKFSPFVGVAVGTTSLKFGIMPRIGVELFRNIRLTAGYLFAGQDNSHFNATLGLAFGRRKR